MEPSYSIPYLPEEQSRKQFAQNCVDSLAQLELIMDSIFTEIVSNITERSEKVKKLKTRAEAAQKKVEQLKGRSTATQVFSSPNFPGRTACEPSKCLFTEKRKGFSLRKCDDVVIEPYIINEKMHPTRMVQKLQKHPDRKKREVRHGISKLPSHTSSASSILLYNTEFNLYDNYQLVDSLSRNSGSRIGLKNTLNEELLAEAPMSITNTDNENFIAKDDFHYLPDLTDLPEFDLPLELPSLPGIANDLLYEGDAGPHIAPSYFLPDLPQEVEVVETEIISNKDIKAVQNMSINEPQVSVSKVTESKQDDVIVERKQIVSSPAHIPPPPPLPEAMMAPPQPPPPPPVMIPVTRKKESDHKAVVLNLPSDSRSNLMKAIQQAGGSSKAKLRKVGATDKSNVLEQPKPKTAPAGDYMSDLFSKLAQRRKGISGVGVNKENEPQKELHKLGTLQQMSSLIPPPPKSGDDTDKVSDDDWD